jgi:predicted regulator of Ras-like GTPase activity (Roadblock/LC7/MglB family)
VLLARAVSLLALAWFFVTPYTARTKGQAMRRIVEDLIRVEGVIGSLLVGKDGLVVASTLLDDEDAEVLGAMSAAVFGEINKATKRIGVGNLVDSIIDAQDGSILMLEAKELILVVITQRMVNLGLVKMEMRRASKRISEAVPI